MRIKTLNILSSIVFALSIMCIPLPAKAQTPFVFDLPWDHSAAKTYIQFLGVGAITIGYYYDSSGAQQTISSNTPYCLANLISPTPIATSVPTGKPAIMITNAPAARLYINYGTSGLTIPNASYTPDAAGAFVDGSPTDPNYTARYQYTEITASSGTQTWLDLSYIDFVSIPLTIAVKNGPTLANNPQTTSVTARVLALAAAGSSSPTNANVIPAGSLPSGTNAWNASFARVLGTNLAAKAGFTYYHDWSAYLAGLATTSTTATLDDCFVGVGASDDPLQQQQTYSYTADFLSTCDNPSDTSSGCVSLTANSGSGYAGAVNFCVGNGNTGTGVGDSNKVWIMYSDLQSNTVGVYSNNTPYYYQIGSGAVVHETAIVNDYFGRVVGDILGGLSFGVFGSTTQYVKTGSGDPIPAQAIGQIPSLYWWAGKNATYATPPAQSILGQGYIFGKLQTNGNNYDDYAASFSTLTTGYGIPFGDRLGLNTIEMNYPLLTGEYVLITIGPDTPPPPTAPVDLLLLGNN